MTMPPHLFYPGDNRHGRRRLAAPGIVVDRSIRNGAATRCAEKRLRTLRCGAMQFDATGQAWLTFDRDAGASRQPHTLIDSGLAPE